MDRELRKLERLASIESENKSASINHQASLKRIEQTGKKKRVRKTKIKPLIEIAGIALNSIMIPLERPTGASSDSYLKFPDSQYRVVENAGVISIQIPWELALQICFSDTIELVRNKPIQLKISGVEISCLFKNLIQPSYNAFERNKVKLLFERVESDAQSQ